MPLPFPWLVRSTLAVLILPPLVHFLPFPTLIRWIDRTAAGRGSGPDERALADWVDRLQTRLPGPWHRTCLKRAFVLYYLLKRSGVPAELRIGVRRDAGQKLAAHAWLVRHGEPILEEGADHLGNYRVLSSFPEAGR